MLHNIVALTAIQLLGYVLPFITLPYATRVLGLEAWGKVAFINGILGYFSLVIAWGFGLSGTRKAAACRDNPEKLSHVFMSIWAAQWCLVVALSFVLLGLLNFVEFFSRDTEFYAYGFLGFLGNVLFSTWFLNGVERIKELASIQILWRLLSVPLTFLLVKTPADAPLLIGISNLTSVLGGVSAIWWMSKNLELKWELPSAKSVTAELREGGSVFLASVWIGLYTSLTPTLLGFLSGAGAVAQYALPDRLKSTAQSALSPISQALFPRLSHLFENDATAAKRLLLKSSAVLICCSGIGSLILWLFAHEIIFLLGGIEFLESAIVLKWLAPLPFIVVFSNIFGIQIMLPNHMSKAFNRILGCAGFISLLMIYPLVSFMGAEGAAINTFVVECFVSFAMGFYLWKQGFFKKRIS